MTQPAERSDAAPGPGDQPLLNARLLGPMLVTLNGRRVDTTSSRRTRYLLAYLLLHRRSAVPRDVLMETFWPDARPAAARNSLHVALTGVRRVLGRAWPGRCWCAGTAATSSCPTCPIWVDVDEFERCCRDGRRADRRGADERALAAYAAADRLYGGDLLAEDPYADWASLVPGFAAPRPARRAAPAGRAARGRGRPRGRRAGRPAGAGDRPVQRAAAPAADAQLPRHRTAPPGADPVPPLRRAAVAGAPGAAVRRDPRSCTSGCAGRRAAQARRTA